MAFISSKQSLGNLINLTHSAGLGNVNSGAESEFQIPRTFCSLKNWHLHSNVSWFSKKQARTDDWEEVPSAPPCPAPFCPAPFLFRPAPWLRTRLRERQRNHISQSAPPPQRPYGRPRAPEPSGEAARPGTMAPSWPLRVSPRLRTAEERRVLRDEEGARRAGGVPGLALGACLGFVYPLCIPEPPRGAAGLSGRPALGGPLGRCGVRRRERRRRRGPGPPYSPSRARWCSLRGTPDASAGCPSLQLAFSPVLLISESLTGCLSFVRTRAREPVQPNQRSGHSCWNSTGIIHLKADCRSGNGGGHAIQALNIPSRSSALLKILWHTVE